VFFPEFLYRLTQRDQALTWLDPVWAESDAIVATTAPNGTVLTVPQDRLLLVQTLSLVGLPGAGQNNTFLRATIRPPQGNQSIRLVQEAFTTAGNHTANWQGSAVVPPSWSITFESVFDAAVNPNQVICSAGGMLIPPGNIQRI
jgi:hypothetical protein